MLEAGSHQTITLVAVTPIPWVSGTAVSVCKCLALTPLQRLVEDAHDADVEAAVAHVCAPGQQASLCLCEGV